MQSGPDSSRIFLPIVMIAGLAVAIFMGRWVAQGAYTNLLYVFMLCFGTTFLLWMGNRYWYGIPFALGSGLPALPLGFRNIELGELMIASAMAIFVAHVAMKTEKAKIFRTSHIPILLFMGWVAMIYATNPTGLVIIGSETAGARYYIKLVLAFGAFIILASQDLSDARLKWPIRLIFLGLAISAVYGFLSYRFLGAPESVVSTGEEEGSYTWHQALSGPSVTLAFLLFAKYKPSQVFNIGRFYLAFIYLATIAITLLSGKRMGMIAVLLAPFISAVVHRQFRYVFAACILIIAGSGIIIAGQGNVFSLPKSMQRAISFLPANWDPDFENMSLGNDDFRAELRRFAAEKVRKNPVIGQGFAVNVSETASAITAATGGGDVTTQTLAGALGHAWHNTWIGYSADFGIPLAVIHASIWVTVIVISFRLSRLIPPGSYRSIFVIYVLMFTIRDIVASHTSGHSALDAFNRWWMYGAVFSIWASYWAANKTEKAPAKPPYMMGSGNSPIGVKLA